MNDTSKLMATGGNRRTRILFYTLVVVLLGAAAWILFWPHDTLQPGGPSELLQRQTPGSGERQVVLYFADSAARTHVTERRPVPFGESLEESVEATLRALAAGPSQATGVRVLPPEARLEQTYFADETATLYLDFNAALITQHPGGSAAEYNTISALVRTIGANFPDVTRIQILVDGQPVDTLAGHFDTSKPIEVANWQ
jgi:spore germination protein GerM